jgi:hypothetical protein
MLFFMTRVHSSGASVVTVPVMLNSLAHDLHTLSDGRIKMRKAMMIVIVMLLASIPALA